MAFVGIILLSVFFAAIYYFRTNSVNLSQVESSKSQFNIVSSNELIVNKPLRKADVSVEPKIELDVILEKSLLSTKVIVKPKNRWTVNTEYFVTLSNITTDYNVALPNLNYSFKTQTAPKFEEVIPANQAKNISLKTELKLKLDAPNNNLIEPKFSISPEAPFKFSLSEDKNEYNLRFEKPLRQSTTYNLVVTDSMRNNLKIFESSFSTIPKLSVVNFSPKGGGIYKNTDIKIGFDQDVDRASIEKSFAVSPSVSGSFVWSSNREFTYKLNQNFELARNYSIRVGAGAKSVSESFLESDFVSGFTTIGYVAASFSPRSGASEVNLNSPISVYFNQEVDRASAQANFYINPYVSGSFGWSNNTMTFYPKGQGYLTRYVVGVNPGVKSINGLNSISKFSSSYTTLTPTKTLNVRFDRQDYSLSCEFASLKMALAAKGVYVSENQLIGLVGYNGPSTKTSDNKWGNPYLGFVGSLNGNGTSTGYGVYWGPIAAAANNFRPATAFTGGSVYTLASAIDQGNPVIIWGPIGNGSRIDWIDISTGQKIYAVRGEHARVVRGYKGLASNPLGFYISDPIYGNFYWSKAQLLANWGWFGNAGIIIR